MTTLNHGSTEYPAPKSSFNFGESARGPRSVPLTSNTMTVSSSYSRSAPPGLRCVSRFEYHVSFRNDSDRFVLTGIRAVQLYGLVTPLGNRGASEWLAGRQAR